MTALRVVFMGTPDFAVPALKALIDGPHDVIAVYSQPPRPKGRGQQVQKSPVHETADAAGIPVHTPLSLKKDPEAVAQFQALQADVAVVAAYGLILPQTVLDAPKFGCLNIHASLLPRWRGASPIQHAVWHNDAESGVTIMQMEAGLDTGPMLSKQSVQLTPHTTAASLHDELSAMGGGMIAGILAQLAAGQAPSPEPQNDAESCYAPLLKKEDGLIDWSRSATEIDAQVRALNPWPGTYAITHNGRLKVLAGGPGPHQQDAAGTVLSRDGLIACGDATTYRLGRVQPENAKAMDAGAAVNGGYLKPGQPL